MQDLNEIDEIKENLKKLQEKVDLDEKNKFHKNIPIIISAIALAFSFGTTGFSYYQTHLDDIRDNRREARELIQRVSKLPIENFELMSKHEGSALGESLSGMINQENILLASQAVEMIRRYPDSFSSTEYFAVAFALSQSSIRDNVPYLFENAIARSKNHNDYNVSTRAYGIYHFMQGDFTQGRKFFEMALGVWELFPEKNPFVINSFDLITLLYWSGAELSVNNYAKAVELLERAKESLGKLPPGQATAPFERQFRDVEQRLQSYRIHQLE